MEELKSKWIKLNKKYDDLILDIFENKDVKLSLLKKMQKELFDIENEIFDLINRNNGK
jgi:hypothetical protein